MLDRILCLANSYKHDHRCVAGISLITNQWIRLVGQKVPGCLTIKEASYPDGQELRILDVFEAELDESCGSNSHPEDMFLNPKPFRHIERFDRPQHYRQLDGHVSKNLTLLQSCSDRIYFRKFESTSASSSLELIKPDDLWWWIRDEAGKRKSRALFRIGSASRIRYDLAVTDPFWLQQLNLLSPGVYPNSLLLGDTPGRTHLTVSLSEPFENFHYKLVAGVISVPEVPRRHDSSPRQPAVDRLPSAWHPNRKMIRNVS